MNRDHTKKDLKRQLNSLFKSMDFIADNFLSEKKKVSKEEFQIYFNIYQQLGWTWEFLGLQCEHWDGYRKTREKKEACRICGKIRETEETYYLLPKNGEKKIGAKLRPNSKRTFQTKKAAEIIHDAIDFHGASIDVDVFNSYKSKIIDHDISIAADRIVKVKEGNVECHIDDYLVVVKLIDKEPKGRGRRYGGFPWEIRKKDLKNFPVIFEYDRRHRFFGLRIFR